MGQRAEVDEGCRSEYSESSTWEIDVHTTAIVKESDAGS